MKKGLLLFILFLSFQGYSQKDSIVNYLGRKYEKISKDKAWYIQTIVKKKDLWRATVYFLNGKPKLDGTFKERKLKTRVGIFKVYNEQGKLKSIQKYNSKGKKQGNYFYFNDDGEQIISGFFQNSKRESVWKYFDNAKNVRARVLFKKGKVLNYKLWNEYGEVLKEELILSRKPEFKPGFKSFKLKLKKGLVKELEEEGLKTNFLVKIKITDSGKINKVSIVPKLKEQYENRIKDFFYNLKDVEPAILVNRKISSNLSLPIIIN